MKNLETFIEKIEGFEELTAGLKIDFFAYYLISEGEKRDFGAKDILVCFESLHLHAYSNINSYLSFNSRGKRKKFLKNSDGLYKLERTYKQMLESQIGIPVLKSNVYSDFFPIEIFENTRGYLENIANQALTCYNKGIFDGCSVLSRKLIEILIIECFERHGNENLIKKEDGSFFFLSDLITEFLKEPSWNIGRNAKAGLPKIKKLGDHSAHNRRYIARKGDLDSIKDDFRVVLEELVHLIDYRNWVK